MENIKRAHHYVWRHYLEAWETDGRLCCLRDGKAKPINAINLAVENDFYRLPELNDAELQFAILFAKSMPSYGEQVFKGFLKYFTAHSRIRSALGGDIEVNSELDHALKVYKSNTEEDYHASIEKRAIPILAAIKSGDISFYRDSERSIDFVYFIATQVVRTRKLRDSLSPGLGEKFGIDVAKVWQIASHFVASNLGANLYIRRLDDPITLIVNDTRTGLITSDQPVINYYAGQPRASKELAVYYPVSPTRAILFGDLDGDVPVPIWSLDEDQVRRLNSLMLRESHMMAFARSEGDFETAKTD